MNRGDVVTFRRYGRVGAPRAGDAGIVMHGEVVKCNGSKLAVRADDGRIYWVPRKLITKVDVAWAYHPACLLAPEVAQ